MSDRFVVEEIKTSSSGNVSFKFYVVDSWKQKTDVGYFCEPCRTLEEAQELANIWNKDHDREANK